MTDESTQPEPAHGFNRMTPYFTVSEPEALITFMIAVFDAELLKKDVYDDGCVQHARLKVEGSLMMLNQASDDYPAQSSQGLGLGGCVDHGAKSNISRVTVEIIP